MKNVKYWSYASLLLLGTFAFGSGEGAIAQMLAPESETPPVTELEPIEIAPTPSSNNPEPSTPEQTQETQPEGEERSTETNTFSPRGGIGYTTNGAGYNDGFTSFETWVPVFQTPGKSLTFLEGHLLLQNNAALGGNVILGQRFYDESAHRVYGGYIAYDNRSTGNNFFNQLGVGFETLGEDWDFRINGYFPIGETRQLSSESYPGVFGFQGHNLLLDRTRNFESAATSVDAEFGGNLARWDKGSLRGYGGVYYLTASGGDSAVGARGRLELRPTDYMTVGLSVQHDSIFDTKVVASVGLTFPGSSARGNGEEKPEGLDRMGESVARQSAIVVVEQTEKDKVAALNPETNQPWWFQHVVLGANGGNGTFEAPFGAVQPGLDATRSDRNDIVYVQPGDNSVIPPFKIGDRVQVLSTGPVQEQDTVQLGRIVLPLSGAGLLPTVNPAVEMGNFSTLSGFYLPNAPGAAIAARNVQGVTIRDNRIENSAEEGILLEEVTGQNKIANNTIDGTNSSNGITLNNSAGVVDLNIANNTIARAAENGVGLNLKETAEGNIGISGSTMTENGRRGIGLRFIDTARGNLKIENNNIHDNGSNGIGATLKDRSQGTIAISNNEIANNGFRNLTQITALNGIGIDLSENAIGKFNISNNAIHDNFNDGIASSFFDASQAIYTISNNTITGNGNNGIELTPLASSTATLTIGGNTSAKNGRNGIYIDPQGFSVATATIANNIAFGNGLDGISNRPVENAVLQSLIEGNTTTDNGRFGIEMTAADNARLFTSVRGNVLSGNPGSSAPDPVFPYDFGSQTVGTSTLCLNLSNNVSSQGFLLNPVAGSFSANVQGNTGPILQTNAINPLGVCPVP